ncbi:DMT family transporter [Pseudomonas aeruginosa]|uniref:DMT family transporter n=1 Tax=Pseudomonas aeruginosa TaxID=287 RepID=UPI0018C4EEDF|nr:DMT family transporter [Pseudomonas aeruginosa]EKL8567111.1 DMT family transporter [Pseudomonas aeruginosa]ELF1012759.1 DMT family transporter [Pseudomonas aeruginosa]MBG5221751.1 DMT family transporter [Pseudomonas aeruginosa]MBG6333302.1 DMT family transporter [Pseudomonas aeruginosa]MBH9451313.1 DMT family transporter [Pseudomonas aeruginosa]
MPWNHWSTERLGIALAVLAALGFSFKAIFVKLAYAAAAVDAVTLLTLRMTFALPIALWASLWLCRTAPPLSRKDWGLLLVLGVLGYYGASILDFIGLQYISAALERLILFIYPTLTVLIGVLFMGKALEKRQVAALALSYAGIGLAFAHDLQVTDDMPAVLLGGAFIFGSALSYALYSAGAEVAIRRLGTLRFAALAIIVSTFATQLHFVLTQPFNALAQPLEVYAYAAAMALFSTVLPVFWQSAAVQRIGAARTVLIGTLGPMLTIFFAWLLLSEPVSIAQLLGAGLVLAGVMLVSRRQRPRSAQRGGAGK